MGWSPDGKGVLFTSQCGEGFMGKLYVVPVDGGAVRDAGPDMGVSGCYSPDGKKLALNRKAQSYWRKYYRGAYQSDVTVMDIAAKTFKDLTNFDGMDSWPLWGHDGFIYFVSDREGKGLTNIWRVSENGGDAEQITRFTSGDVRFRSISSDGKTIVFEHDFGISKLDVASREVKPLKFDIEAETAETLTEYRDVNSTAEDYDLANHDRQARNGRPGTAEGAEARPRREVTIPAEDTAGSRAPVSLFGDRSVDLSLPPGAIRRAVAFRKRIATIRANKQTEAIDRERHRPVTGPAPLMSFLNMPIFRDLNFFVLRSIWFWLVCLAIGRM